MDEQIDKQMQEIYKAIFGTMLWSYLSLWDFSNDKLADGYKLQTLHKQQLVY